jgi:hypothetical protein
MRALSAGNWLVLAELAQHQKLDRAGTEEAGMRRETLVGSPSREMASVRAALGCRDRARCAFLRIVTLSQGESVNAAWRNGALSKAGRR